MGFYANKSTTTKKGRGFYSRTSKKNDTGIDLESLVTLASQAGYTPPKPSGTSMLDKALGFISSLETAPAALAAVKGENPLTSYAQSVGKGLTGQQKLGEKVGYSDVLKEMGMPEGKILGPVSLRGISGLAGDILLDPGNWFGGFLAKLGLKSAKTVGKTTAKLGGKLPIVGGKVTDLSNKVTKATHTIEDLFVPGAKIKRLPGGEKFWDEWMKLQKETRGDQNLLVEKIAEMSKQARKAGISNAEILEMEKGLKKLATKTKVTQATKGVPEGGVLGGVKEVAEETAQKNPVLTEIQNALRGLYKSWGKGEKEMGLLKTEIEDYLPHIMTKEAKEALGKGSFSDATIKPLRAKLSAAKPRKYQGTIEEINKEFAEKHGFNLFEEDVFKITAARGVSHVRAIKVKKFIDEVEQKFGKEITAEFTGAPQIIDGIKYVGWTPESKLRFFKGKQGPLDEAMNTVEGGLKKAFPQKTFIGVAKNKPKFLLPEQIAEHLDKSYNFLTNDEAISDLLQTYDKVLGIWKGSVTGFFPSFHGRNLISGMFNNYLAGMNLKDIKQYSNLSKVLKGADDEIVTLGGKTFRVIELKDLMRQNGILGQTGFLDVAKTLEQTLNPRKGLAKVLDLPQKAMTEVENLNRGVLFLDGLNKKMSPWDSAKRVMQFHFDYMPEGLTTFEKNVMKRLIPFYTWSRNNIPLQITQMIEHPEKYGKVMKTMRMLQGDTVEKRNDTEALPSYMKEGLPIRVGGNEENPQFTYGSGLPIEDLNKLNPTDLISMMSPLLLRPLEFASGYNFFADKPMEKSTTAPSYTRFAPEAIKKAIGYRENTADDGTIFRNMNPKMLALLNALGGRFSSTADKLVSDKLTPMAKLTNFITGTKTRQVNVSEEEKRRLNEQLLELQKYLTEMGLMRQFTNYYVPKEDK